VDLIPQFRYSAWDGTQELPSFSADDLLDQLADDLLRGGDPREALRDLLRRGFQLPDGRRFDGLRRLLEQMDRQRKAMLEHYDPSGLIDAIREQLDEILRMEREAINARRQAAKSRGLQSQTGNNSQPATNQQQTGTVGNEGRADTAPTAQTGQQGHAGQMGQQGRTGQMGADQQAGTQEASASGQGGAGSGELNEAALQEMLERMLQRKEAQLNQLPPDNAGRIRGLREYDFLSPEAREAFEQLIGGMQRRLLQQYSQQLKQGIGEITPEDLAAIRQMVQELNQMIEASRQGDRGAFEEFMERWGQNFPPGIENLDDLLQYLQQQSMQIQALLDSMDPEARQELMDMMAELLRDDRLQLDLARLAQNLADMGYPIHGGGFPFEGSEIPGFGESLDMMRRLQAMERLEQALAGDPLAALFDAATAQMGDPTSLFGPRLGGQIEAVKDMVQALLEAGYLKRDGNRLELTPRAIRKLGDSALREIFKRLKDDRLGGHQIHRRGTGGDITQQSRPYQFGDPFHVDLRSTIMNGVRRGGAGTPVRLGPTDFDVYETERAVRHATVLAIDMSRSMFLRGLFLEAKKTALALDSLIRGQFPHDALYIIGFADMAYELTPNDLPALAENYMVQGTNYEMALALARRLLSRHRSGNRQVLFITDGEPTACSIPNGIYVNYPAPPFVRQAALAEAARCNREGIIINTFMLDDDPALIAFVERMTAVNHGRAFLTGPYHLGEQVLLDYLDQRVVKRL
jgi:uncharacterized protein with von Willebrand factor type A (vWA) domain